MFGKITMTQRINAGLALAVVIILIFATNRIDQRHFETTQNTVDAVFNDRVVAQNYIYQIRNLITDIKVQVLTDSARATQKESVEKLEVLLDQFGKTKLTVEEMRSYELLQDQIDQLSTQSQKWSTRSKPPIESSLVNMLSLMGDIEINLNGLAEIQLKESRHLTGVAQKSLNTTTLISNMEIALLVIAGIALQFVIFYRERKKRVETSISLN